MLVLKLRNLIDLILIILVTAVGLGSAAAMDRVRVTTRTDEAVTKYGLTGKGVTIVFMDRGIEWRHPDFIKPDGTTRIKWILDMTGQNGCRETNPSPVEYTEAQINAALTVGPAINHRDAVGHGTVTTGLATGNGTAFANGKYHGMAPEADLIIVKITSDGVPAHDTHPAEAAFVACVPDALDWVDAKINELGQPAVAIMNMGVQSGPLDGTSFESRLIDEIFGLDRPGRIYATGTGDEGGLPTHSGGTFEQNSETVIRFTKAASATSDVFAWYSGSQPAEVTLTFDDGTMVGPVAPGTFGFVQDGVTVWHYLPNGLDPWQSTSGDRLVFFRITGHAGSGSFRFRGLQPGTGRFDLYTPIRSSVTFNDHLVPGRLNSFAVTHSAVVAAVEVARTSYVDIDGISRSRSAGAAGDLWTGSAAGPTRDGRLGVDVTTAAHTSFAAYGPETWWRTFRGNVIQDGGGWYGSAGAASASGPILTGAVALMLQLDPSLTAREIKEILHATAVSDNFTGITPNPQWGYGKLDMLKVLDAILTTLNGTDLSLKKIESPLTGSIGQNFTYKFSVSNNGPDTATAVVFTHHIAAQATLISATSDHGICSGLTEIICNLGALNVAESGTVTIVVNAAADGEHIHTAGIAANESDPNPANNSLAATTLVSSGPLTLTASLPEGEVGVSYSAALQISGGTPPYSISVIKGSLPAGLRFNSPTTITGIPEVAKKFSLTINITDQNGSISKKLALNIRRALNVNTQSLKVGKIGKRYTMTLKAAGGTAPYTWTLISGTLPSSLAFDAATGRITGTPTSAGTSNLTFQLNDPQGGTAQKSLILLVN